MILKSEEDREVIGYALESDSSRVCGVYNIYIMDIKRSIGLYKYYVSNNKKTSKNN
jgi:hypothetical protein